MNVNEITQWIAIGGSFGFGLVGLGVAIGTMRSVVARARHVARSVAREESRSLWHAHDKGLAELRGEILAALGSRARGQGIRIRSEEADEEAA